MVKLIIFFRHPVDVPAFEDHFSHRHVPLIAAMPGVVRTSVSRALGAPRGEPPYYLVHDVYFADMAALNYALNSAQGRAAGADLMAFARNIVSLMFAEVWGEDPLEMGLIPQAVSQPSHTRADPAEETTSETDIGAEGASAALAEEHLAQQPAGTDQQPMPAAIATLDVAAPESPYAAPHPLQQEGPA